MEKRKPELVCLGELLIDFTPAGTSAGGMALYERNPGGAPANVAVAATRLGLSAAFIGKVGADLHGRFLKGILEKDSCRYCGLHNSRNTGGQDADQVQDIQDADLSAADYPGI